MTRSICRSRDVAFTLVELLIVILILAALIAVLLPSLNRAREKAMKVRMAAEQRETERREEIVRPTPTPQVTQPSRPLAIVSTFQAKVDLTPRLSVGTAEPESIYEARIDAVLTARSDADNQADSEIQLPLPPQIISLGDLVLSIGGVESDAVALEQDRLVWHGKLPNAATDVRVQYTAVGRGIYSLQTPPGRIIDRFKIELTANGSDVRMLELSLQPTSFTHGSNQTTYVWDYKRLMFGRPISLDVLGIAPIDRLGELSWLGPLSVIFFGIVVGLMARAFDVVNFDRWMLLLVLGTFTGAYPLMYFAQQFIPLKWAMGGAVTLVMLIIAGRVVSIMGVKIGLAGVTLPAAIIMIATLFAAVHPNLQGIVITAMVLGLFVLTMLLAPRMQRTPAVSVAGLQAS
jgi:Tfp pilus assembly protein PilE